MGRFGALFLAPDNGHRRRIKVFADGNGSHIIRQSGGHCFGAETRLHENPLTAGVEGGPEIVRLIANKWRLFGSRAVVGERFPQHAGGRLSARGI